MQTLRVAEVCRKLIDAGDSTSIRDLFYNLKVPIKSAATARPRSWSSSSRTSPTRSSRTSRSRSAPCARSSASTPSPRAPWSARMTIVDNGDRIDLAAMGSGGWAVPSIVEADVIQFVKCSAKFVLLIEKGAIWQRFNKDRFWDREKCLIIHGGGQPPRGVRRLVYRMHHELKLPVYVLVDNDPWGYYIYSVVKQGSINLAFESQRMAIPAARFVGMSSFDAERFDIPSHVPMPLTEEDRRRAKEIRAYPWFAKKEWQREIKHMEALGVKLELEALSQQALQLHHGGVPAQEAGGEAVAGLGPRREGWHRPMRIRWEVTPEDVIRVTALIDAHETNPLVQDRRSANVERHDLALSPEGSLG